MPDRDDDFYAIPGPTYLQQADVFDDVPLFDLPTLNQLVLLRELDTLARVDELRPGSFAVVDENDAYKPFYQGAREYVVMSAARGAALLITQTCNIDHADELLVSPLLALEGTRIDRGNLFAGKYASLFGLRAHPDGLYDESYIDLRILKAVHKEQLDIEDRVASLQPVRQFAFMGQIATAIARDWGNAAGEEVEEDGKYRCLRCNRWHDIGENPVIELRKGQLFPRCERCAALNGKSAQWQLLFRYQNY